MENNLVIVGSEMDRAHMENLKANLSANGYHVSVEYPNADESTWPTSVDTNCAILWLSPYTGDEVYSIANRRNNMDRKTLNVFSGSFPLPVNAKQYIGSNHSVFTDVSDNVADELRHLLPSLTLVANPTPAPTMNQPEPKMTQSASVQNNSTTEMETSGSGKWPLWMPLIWYICSFIYDICISGGIIRAWTDSYWFLVVTAVYFYLCYKIIRSTISAIKINKWCCAYIPFSLYMIMYDLYIGFGLLNGYLEN